MTVLTWLMVAAALIAAIALTMTIVNLGVYRRSPADATLPDRSSALPLVSVCVPARNEEANIEACVRSLLDNNGTTGEPTGSPLVEVVVYDDQSTDATPRLIQNMIDEEVSRAGSPAEPLLRRAPTVPLPPEWNGKQHACWRMSRAARGDWLLFTDADVRFTPDALRRSIARAQRLNADLLSTFPRQIMGTAGEAMIVPMIFFVLFSYLPMPRMRTTKDPATSAGCGQFLLVRRRAYESFGGHSAFKSTMHDGIKMPREVRRAGFRTDLFDGSDLCSVRMYRGLAQTWRGFAKNAYEGLGSPGLLIFLTLLHALGHVLPWLVVAVAAIDRTIGVPTNLAAAFGLRHRLADRTALVFAACAVIMAIVQRLVLAQRLRQGKLGFLAAFLHPIGVIAMTAVQWYSLFLHLTGRRAWRGRLATGASA